VSTSDRRQTLTTDNVTSDNGSAFVEAVGGYEQVLCRHPLGSFGTDVMGERTQ
jgi:hypothetical protein